MLHRLPALALVALLLAASGASALAQPAAPPAYAPPPPYEPPPYAPQPAVPGAQPAPPPQQQAAPSRASDATAIRDAITGWTDAFNARQTDAVCTLFAPDLEFTFGAQPGGTYDELCGRLRSALANRNAGYRYTPEIHEILISGDLAVVRLVWTLVITRPPPAAPLTVTEPAMYVMRHDPDGNWRVFRFLAFTLPIHPPPR